VKLSNAPCTISPVDLDALPRTLRQAHREYIEAAAQSRRISSWQYDHCPGVVDYLESVVKKALPVPRYMQMQALPEELDSASDFHEGARYRITVNAYEREPRARLECVAHYGSRCCICRMSFAARYGAIAEGFIHVHHLRPLSTIGKEYKIDPIADLRPVCPNCHAVLHIRGFREPAYEIDEVRAFLKQSRSKRLSRKRTRER
jgi:predicted HNH restriction endonuclease